MAGNMSVTDRARKDAKLAVLAQFEPGSLWRSDWARASTGQKSCDARVADVAPKLKRRAAVRHDEIKPPIARGIVAGNPYAPDRHRIPKLFVAVPHIVMAIIGKAQLRAAIGPWGRPSSSGLRSSFSSQAKNGRSGAARPTQLPSARVGQSAPSPQVAPKAVEQASLLSNTKAHLPP